MTVPGAAGGAPHKRAVVTGGAGFLGRAIRRGLRELGWAVDAVDVRPGPAVVTGDVTRPGAWTAVLDGADLLVHAAALLPDVEDRSAHRDVNIGGTQVVMERCSRHGVPRVVHLSTTAVLGNDFPDRADETHPVQMTGHPYTDSKIAAEHVALTAGAAGLPVTIVRPGEVYGPHSGLWTVRVLTLLKRNLFALVDGGAGVMSPIYVDDLVSGVITAACRPSGIGQIFHLTGGEGVAAADFFGAYGAMVGKGIPILPNAALQPLAASAQAILRPLGLPSPLSGRAVEFMRRPGTVSIAKALRLLDWQPEISLEEGMARTEVWLQDVGLL